MLNPAFLGSVDSCDVVFDAELMGNGWIGDKKEFISSGERFDKCGWVGVVPLPDLDT